MVEMVWKVIMPQSSKLNIHSHNEQSPQHTYTKFQFICCICPWIFNRLQHRVLPPQHIAMNGREEKNCDSPRIEFHSGYRFGKIVQLCLLAHLCGSHIDWRKHCTRCAASMQFPTNIHTLYMQIVVAKMLHVVELHHFFCFCCFSIMGIKQWTWLFATVATTRSIALQHPNARSTNTLRCYYMVCLLLQQQYVQIYSR